MVWVLLLVVLEVWAVLRTILFSHFLWQPLRRILFGTDWYAIVALEPVCQNSRPASCAVEKWIQYTASCSGLQWIRYCTFLGVVVSVIDSASSASLLKGSRGVKKIVCLPSLRSFPPASSTHVINKSLPFVRKHHVIHQFRWDEHSTWVTLDRTNKS